MKTSKVLLLILFVCIGIKCSSQWTKVNGLDSLSVHSIAVNENNGIIYAATNQYQSFRGVFYNTSLTGSWMKIHKGIETLSVEKLAVDSSGTLYLATSQGVYYCSNNDTCLPINQGLFFYGGYPSVGCISIIDGYLYAGTDTGIYRTPKNNINWQRFNQNIPDGTTAKKILKYHGDLIACFSENVYRSEINFPNWVPSVIDHHTSAPTFFDMAASDSAIYLAATGGYSHSYRSIGDSMNFLSCAFTNTTTAYSVLTYQNDFWVGTLYEGVYKGTDYGTTLDKPYYNVPANSSIVLSLAKYGTALLAGTEFFYPMFGFGGIGGIYYPTNSPLAVNNESFKALLKNKKIKLSWQNSKDDLSIKAFEIQRSFDNDNTFATIGNVDFQRGVNVYSYFDNNIQQAKKVIRYRLKTIDNEGSIAYSKVVSVKITSIDIAFTISPNPASNNLILHHIANTASMQHVSIYNLAGVKIFKRLWYTNQDDHINVSNFPKGLYIIKIDSDRNAYYEKAILGN